MNSYRACFAMLLIATCIKPVIAESEIDKTQKRLAIEAWQSFLDGDFKNGDAEALILSRLHDVKRDVGKVHYGGTGNYRLCVLIDDFHQLNFECNADGELTSRPYVSKAMKWVKFPKARIHEIEVDEKR